MSDCAFDCNNYIIRSSHLYDCNVCISRFIISQQFALTIVALLILVITARVHPYTETWENYFEGLILLDLVFISAYFLDNNRLSSTSNSSFVIVLLILPFIYFFLYLLVKILRWVTINETCIYSKYSDFAITSGRDS